MKKILLLFAMTGLLTLTGCNNDDDLVVAGNTEQRNETFEVGPVNFTAAGEFTSYYELNPVIGSSDVILVYRLVSNPDAAEDIWEPVPATYDFDEGTIKYNYDFTVRNIAFYFDANFDVSTFTNYTTRQFFRIVILKGFDNSANRVDFRDYNAVIKKYNVVETNRANSTRK